MDKSKGQGGVLVSRVDLVQSVESALKDYFFDGVSSTLGQYAVDHIIGDICQRVFDRQSVTEDK